MTMKIPVQGRKHEHLEYDRVQASSALYLALQTSVAHALWNIKNWHAVNCKTSLVVWEYDYTRGTAFLGLSKKRAHAQVPSVLKIGEGISASAFDCIAKKSYPRV
ncbi:unnamed protein product [Ixodes pacificus]